MLERRKYAGKKNKLLSDNLLPYGTLNSRLHGLSKLTKVGLPTRPILDTLNSPQNF